MSMYSLLRSAEHAPGMEEIEEHLAGNLWCALSLAHPCSLHYLLRC